MADWTNIENTTLEPDAPLTSATMFALRDNPQAIAEGASGAPLIENDALEPPSAGTVIGHRFSSGVTTTSTATWNTVGFCYTTRAGSVTVSVDAEISDSDGGGKVRVRKNSSTVQEWDVTSTTSQTFTVDVSFDADDRIDVQVFNNDLRQTSGSNAFLRVAKRVPVFAYNVA